MRHAKTLRATFSGEKPRILQLEDENLEAKTVVEEIALRIKTKENRHPRDFAILCRTNEQPRAFEMELRRANVPYVLVGGMSFYDRKEVRDIMAYLKFILNPHDEVSLLRIINTPARGIGQGTVKRLIETAVAQGTPLWETVCRTAQEGSITPTARKGVGQLRRLVEMYGPVQDTASTADLVRDLINEVNYRQELVRLYPNADDQEARWTAVEEVVNAAGNYSQRAKKPTLGGFLQEIALNGPDADRDKEQQLERDAVVLMTLHAAKGLEFPEVYMVGMEEGLLPHRRSVAVDGEAIDEERRLCYVGVTRAQRRLTLTLALSRRKWGKPRETIPSRFLYEVTGQADNPNYLAAKRGQPRRSKKKHKPASPPQHHGSATVAPQRPADKPQSAAQRSSAKPTTRPGNKPRRHGPP